MPRKQFLYLFLNCDVHLRLTIDSQMATGVQNAQHFFLVGSLQRFFVGSFWIGLLEWGRDV
jgi:hypothetical protein